MSYRTLDRLDIVHALAAARYAVPGQQSAKFELVINAQAARVLGFTVPPTLLARARTR